MSCILKPGTKAVLRTCARRMKLTATTTGCGKQLIDPYIVIAEYNHRFGTDKAVTVPYDAGFVRQKAHHSTIYYDASLKALVNLGKRKGYAFVGCKSAGNNAFFVRRDLLSGLREMSVQEGFVAGKFRESRDERGSCSSFPRKMKISYSHACH